MTRPYIVIQKGEVLTGSDEIKVIDLDRSEGDISYFALEENKELLALLLEYCPFLPVVATVRDHIAWLESQLVAEEVDYTS